MERPLQWSKSTRNTQGFGPSALPTRRKASGVLFLKTKQTKKRARSPCVALDTLEVTIKTKVVLSSSTRPCHTQLGLTVWIYNTQLDGSQILILLLGAHNFCAWALPCSVRPRGISVIQAWTGHQGTKADTHHLRLKGTLPSLPLAVNSDPRAISRKCQTRQGVTQFYLGSTKISPSFRYQNITIKDYFLFILGGTGFFFK